MYIKRQIENQVAEYIVDYQKPIYVSGARQVGKTTLIKHLCKDLDMIYINLFDEKELNDIFNIEYDLDEKTILSKIENIKLREIRPDTILIIDEIQVNYVAFSALKTLNEAKLCKVICSGSNVGPTLFSGSKRAFPVGQFIQFDLAPLSYQEFLVATDNQFLLSKIILGLENKALDENIHNKALELFDLYLEVGGLPEVVVSYIESRNYKLIQTGLYNNYIDDFAKYASPTAIRYLEAIYESIPANLGKENQSFINSSTGFQAAQLRDPLNWLSLSRMAIFCYRVTSVNNPITAGMNYNKFKLFLNDTGLLVNHINYSPRKHGKQQDNIYLGQVRENYMATVLAKHIKQVTYFEHKIEVDFVFHQYNKLIALEIKASTNTKSKALASFINKYQPDYAYKVARKNLEFGTYNHLPLYAVDIIFTNQIAGYFD